MRGKGICLGGWGGVTEGWRDEYGRLGACVVFDGNCCCSAVFMQGM